MQDNPQDNRRRAYAAGSRIARERMAADAPIDAAALAAVEASDIVVVPGTYDHVEQVLAALELPHTLVPPGQLGAVRLRPEQLLVVNCPGQLDRREIAQVREFVERGGSLFTTDWALRHVIEPAFPGVLAYNERPTADDVVRIEIRNRDNPFLRGVLDDADDPVWWLEGSSYPIRVLDPSRVEVLLTSAELEGKYGEAPVAVVFRHGEGEVFHMISHYYLQRTELRTARHAMAASTYAADKGVAMPAAMVADLAVGDVESAHASARLFANVVADKKRRAMETTNLFVYGSLMPGHGRWRAIRRFVAGRERAVVRGRLYLTGSDFPAAVFGVDGRVKGWLLRLRPGARTAALAALDQIEGHLFRQVTVTTEAGDEAIAYEWRDSIDGLTEAPSGRWGG